ncbi:apolipoprotein N-acyltransferase [Ruicaihuangia caeni]|uniref:Apolipoprotein N-acyltransferase n=1 Tax=Ruicaihuangia caeni TaxID=3042517 RepID=A0AAW6T4G6_9MICO|nr:apolipoprotein N-acyltransferase [Klugiella sp. YN-L-19]MDI2098199.1 apolipoprotein N-acyltransferase [Klugiella sp. YN-L-19]
MNTPLPLDPRPTIPSWVALLLAAASGPVLDAAFPDLGVWPLAFLGIAMMLLALRNQPARWAFHIGLVGSLSFYLLHIQWATLFLGPVPWAALSVVMALFGGIGATLIGIAYRMLLRLRRRIVVRLIALPALVAGLWTAREAVQSVWPYGGFAWGRVAQSQSESPLGTLFAWLGVSGVSFVMVFFVALAIEAVLTQQARATLRFVPASVVLVLMLGTPAFPVTIDGQLRIAAVQGNGKTGYFQQRDSGDNLRDQLDATMALRGEDVDLVVWPEGGSDLDPLRNDYAAMAFDLVADTFDAPFIAGTITEREPDVIHNSSLLWLPGEGLADIYDKRHPVPFGEYVPDREFWEPLAPDLIGLIQREYTPGTTDSVFELPAGVRVGVNICFDIVDDGLLRESVRDGAQVIFAQTNNADFGRTDESVQQLAFARIRALELGRTVVNISTVGTSAIVAPDGSTLDQLEWYTQDAMVREIPLSSTETPALRLGAPLEWTIAITSVLVVAALGVTRLATSGAVAARKRASRS